MDYLYESGQIDICEYEQWDEYFTSLFYDARYSLRRLPDFMESLEPAGDAGDSGWVMPAALQPKSRLAQKLSYRCYHDFSENLPRRELAALTGQYGKKICWYLETEKKPPLKGHYFRRRYLIVAGDRYEVVLGNFEPEWGLGITLGYHQGFLNKTENPARNSILFPVKGRYNGFKLKYNSQISPSIMLSYDRSKELRGRMASAALDYRARNISMGLLVNYHLLDNLTTGSEYSNLVPGYYLDLQSGAYTFQLELSESEEKYFAGCFNLRRKFPAGSLLISGWNYHRDYINPYGSGQSNSDYESISIEETGLEYRSRQNGEWGFLAKTNCCLLSGHQSLLAANYWRDGGLEQKYRAKISDRWKIKKTADIILTYLWGDDNLAADYGERQQLRMDLIYGKSTGQYLQLSSEWKRISHSSGGRDYFRVEIKGSFSLAQGTKMIAKLNRIDYDRDDGRPGYWLICLGEDITFAKYIFMRIEVDSRGGDNYSLIDSARITLQLSYSRR